MARRRARTGRGRASAGRRGRAASPSGTAGTPPAPGSSPCRGGRCRPSAPRPSPGPGRCRPPGRRGRSSPAWHVAAPSSRRSSRRVTPGRRPRAGTRSGDSEPTHAEVDRLDPRRHRPERPHPPSARGVPVTHVDAVAPRLLPGGSTAAPAQAAWRDVVAAYVGLTKPRVIELLLLTTVPVMFFAARRRARRWGWWSRPSSAARCRRARRRRSTASTTATSTSRCAAPGAGRCHGTSSRRARRWSSASCSACCRRWSWPSGSTGSPPALACWPNAFYVFVYTMLLKRRTTQNIVWGGAGRLLPGADRLDRRHRRAGLGAGGAVRGGLLLDPAAHLGAGAALPRGLRRRRRADAAGRRAGRRGRPADRRSTAG